MPPKTPSELKEQVERRNEKPHPDDKDVTSEGLVVPRPSLEDFFGNLERVSESEREESEGDESPSDA